MRPAHAVLAILVAVIWGVAFVATRLALDAFTPPQLVVLRFAIAAAPALLLPRPALAWSALIPVGLTLFAGQFLFQFFGIARGMPPGLASVVVQTQAIFTVIFAALALGERPSAAQWGGSLAALGGLGLIGLGVGGELSAAAFALTLVSPVSFGAGNVLLKRLGPADATSLVAWLSLVPPLPALALSLVLDGPLALPRALAAAPAAGLAGAIFLGLVATSLAYALWGGLLRRYPAAAVAPFALLVPLVGALSSAVVFGERFGPLRLAGMALVLAGVAISLAPRRRD
ncbi:MAG TPA: EamA family transporter [Methylomirabilota bacterium]|nr:EamA family transporter [Methylomirabilota bacterium]